MKIENEFPSAVILSFEALQSAFPEEWAAQTKIKKMLDGDRYRYTNGFESREWLQVENKNDVIAVFKLHTLGHNLGSVTVRFKDVNEALFFKLKWL